MIQGRFKCASEFSTFIGEPSVARQDDTARCEWVVPPAGIEPARLTALDFESSASTNSATEAQSQAGILAH